jgi:hypothetical protein
MCVQKLPLPWDTSERRRGQLGDGYRYGYYRRW